jgi:uncharacterized protein (DUF302 family)
MRTLLTSLLVTLFFGCSSHEVPTYEFNSEEMIRVESEFSPISTEERFMNILSQKEIRHFHTIDHRSSAENIGQNLHDSRVITFGKPEIGTAIMQCRQTAGIDLPMRVMIYGDENGKTWVIYNDPLLIIQKHGLLQESCKEPVKDLSRAIFKIVASATKFSTDNIQSQDGNGSLSQLSTEEEEEERGWFDWLIFW